MSNSSGGSKITPMPQAQIGSYRLIEPLASGGMSSVHRGVHIDSGLEVAVKILPPSLAKNSSMLQRFLREAKSVESLEHPSIVTIYDRGFDLGRYYLVLEFVPGGDLHERVRSKGPMAVSEVIHVIKSVAEGLNYAMSRGLIHRDIKPANLLIAPDGQVKITDLGLALGAEDDDERVTRDGTTVGTVDFMAPEQARDSRATTVRSDIYSLGCTAYYLLTGQSPFAGGSLAEKLRKHAQAPPPDVRKMRADAPRAVAQLLVRMMAKKPDDRFADHTELIAALERIEKALADGSIDEVKLDDRPTALFDDDSAESNDKPIAALFDDDDDDIEIDDDDDEPWPSAVTGAAGSSGGVKSPPRPSSSSSSRAPVPSDDDDDDSPPDESGPLAHVELFDDEPLEVATGFPGRPVARRSQDLPLKTMIWRGVGIGVGVVAVVIILTQIVSLIHGTKVEKTEIAADSSTASEATETTTGGEADVVAAAPKISEKSEAKKEEEEVESYNPAAAAGTLETPRSGRNRTGAAAEPKFDPETIAKYIPAWALDDLPEAIEGPKVILSRIASVDDKDAVTSLRRGLDVNGGTIEIDDAGPFYTNDLRIVGKDRLIKAKPGRRPVLIFQSPDANNNYLLEHSALITLDSGDRLVIEGIDFVFDLKGAPSNVKSIFLCRNSNLTLRDCTITVVGKPLTAISLVRVEGSTGGNASRESRIKLLRTTARGQNLTGFDLAGGPAEIAILRSILICGIGVDVSASFASSLSHLWTIGVGRSVFACRRPLIEIGALGRGGDSRDGVHVSALGSILARIDEGDACSMIESRGEDDASLVKLLDWRGIRNQFVGWEGFAATGQGRNRKVTMRNFTEAGKVWKDTEKGSRMVDRAWPRAIAEPWAPIEDLDRLSDESNTIVSKVAHPAPWLYERSIGLFKTMTFTTQATTAPEPSPFPGFGPAIREEARVDPGVFEIVFDAKVPPWEGDLGAFLDKQTIPPGATRLKVKVVNGSGEYKTRAIRPPRGVGLEIEVEKSQAKGAKPLEWVARNPSSPSDLIYVEDADLVLKNVMIRREVNENLAYLVHVENGGCKLIGCKLVCPARQNPGAGRRGDLVLFHAEGNRDRTKSADDILKCEIIDTLMYTGGDSLTLEASRGAVSLDNCAIGAGETAIALRPTTTPADRFWADLVMNRCTIAANRAIVSVGAAFNASPARPWVVSSNHCAFMDLGERDKRKAYLLLGDPGAIQHGFVHWQSIGDAYEVDRFLASNRAKPPARFTPDVRHQWIHIWGSTHIREATGPLQNGGHPAVRFLGEPINSQGEPSNELALDPNPKGVRTRNDVGAELRLDGKKPIARRSG